MIRIILPSAFLFLVGCGSSRTTETTTEKYVIVVMEPKNGHQTVKIDKVLSVERTIGTTHSEGSTSTLNLGELTYDVTKDTGSIETSNGIESMGFEVHKIVDGIKITTHEVMLDPP
jgi:hypothetical protein